MSLGHLLFQFNFLMTVRFTFIAPVFICHIRSLIMFATRMGESEFSEKYEKLDNGSWEPINRSVWSLCDHWVGGEVATGWGQTVGDGSRRHTMVRRPRVGASSDSAAT